MDKLVQHLVRPIVDHPDEVSLQVIEGESVVTLELSVHPDDRDAVEGERGRTLRSIRNILSAAAGSKKASLDLVDDGDDGVEE
ncbi:MAG: KH domain-containing protein [Alphaproteobacteria bacterium]|nr:KH domain-containing protein [Alphaproteobacteria bacterium]